MKFSTTVAALSAVTIAYGQGIGDIPQCALSCFIGPLQTDGCSSLTDFECHCSKPSLIPKVMPCVEDKCPPSAQAEILDQVSKLCASFGITLTLSTAAPTSPVSTETVPSTSEVTTTEETTKVLTTTTPKTTTTKKPTGIITHPYTTGKATETMPTTTKKTQSPTGAAATAGYGPVIALAAVGAAAVVGL